MIVLWIKLAVGCTLALCVAGLLLALSAGWTRRGDRDDNETGGPT